MKTGSPPHTRGIFPHFPPEAPRPRLTPAYAGNINQEMPDEQMAEAHPRIRGEYCALFVRQLRDVGSPPHTRGI